MKKGNCKNLHLVASQPLKEKYASQEKGIEAIVSMSVMFWIMWLWVCYFPPPLWVLAQTVKNLPAMQETRVPSLGQEDPLEKGMATHSSILAWRILGQRSLAGCCLSGHKGSDTTKQLILPSSLWHFLGVFFFFFKVSPLMKSNTHSGVGTVLWTGLCLSNDFSITPFWDGGPLPTFMWIRTSVGGARLLRALCACCRKVARCMSP